MENINEMLKQVLDSSALRHRALVNNIANADTPGYQRRDVSFLSELKTAIETGDPKKIASVKPEMETSKGQEGIDLEKEFAALSENRLLYETSADFLSRKYAGIRKAIKGRL